MSVRGGHVHGGLFLLLHVVVGHEALQPADAHALALDAADALGFALLLLGAYTAADSGQGVGGGDDVIGGVEVALSHLGNELGDAHRHRAAGAAAGIGAVEAAARLGDGGLRRVAQGHLVKIGGANQGILLGHGVLEQGLAGNGLGHDGIQPGQALLQRMHIQLFPVFRLQHLLHDLGVFLLGGHVPDGNVLLALLVELYIRDLISHFSSLP